MPDKKYITIPELARLLGVSRIAVYKRVKNGQIPAARVGRTYVITDQTIKNILGSEVTAKGKKKDRCSCSEGGARIWRCPEKVG